MRSYDQAEAIHPPGNLEAILRWNTCARIINQESSRGMSTAPRTPTLGSDSDDEVPMILRKCMVVLLQTLSEGEALVIRRNSGSSARGGICGPHAGRHQPGKHPDRRARPDLTGEADL